MSAASASAARANSSSSRRAGTSRGKGATAAARIRWDRLGRAAMLCVLVALVYLYASAGVHMLSTWRQAHRDDAVVSAMRHEHALLLGQRAELSKQSTLEEEARQLGMMKKGEQPYIVPGLPNN
jgi:hypothetical protein